ncbi:hypothetical protein EPN18_06290, partial [bacterium]
MNDIAVVKEAFLKATDGLEERLCAMSDGFYCNPETGFNEVKTSQAMREFLKSAGFSIEAGIAGLSTA